MRCDKCAKDFEEKDLQLNHDIPKYMGGKDIDGRHWLCLNCHEKYEFYVMKTFLFNILLKKISPVDFEKGRSIARNIKNKFFKKEDDKNS